MFNYSVISHCSNDAIHNTDNRNLYQIQVDRQLSNMSKFSLQFGKKRKSAVAFEKTDETETPSDGVSTDSAVDADCVRDDLGIKDRPLANDTCEATRDAETFYLENVLRAQPYTGYTRDVYTVLHSRTTNCRYIIDPARSSETYKNMTDYLSITGHTITIDNTRSYVRNFSLDVDCLCRRPLDHPVPHIKESDILQVTKHIVETLKSMFPDRPILQELDTRPPNAKRAKQSLTATPITYDWWRNKCGYHFYSNLPVSLPLHLHLCNTIRAKTQTYRMNIEVPNNMPLPYSAKISRSPYTPNEDTPYAPELFPTETFYELYRFERHSECANYVGMLQLYDKTTLHIHHMDKPRATNRIPAFYDRVNLCSLVPSQEAACAQFQAFLRNATDESKSALEAEASEESGCVGLNMTDRRDVATLRRMSKRLFKKFDNLPMTVGEFVNETKRHLTSKPFEEFMMFFNDLNFNERSANYGNFVRLALSNSGMWLQHYVAALDICMKLPCFEFKLYCLYPLFLPVNSSDTNLLRGDKVTEQFIRLYNTPIKLAYNETWKNILKYMHQLFMMDIKPYMNIEEMVETAMSVKMYMKRSEFLEAVKSKRDQKDKLQTDAITAYITVMRDLKLLMYKENISTWFTMLDPGAYRIFKMENHICINHWLNYEPAARTKLKTMIDSVKASFCINDMWTKCEFMFATQFGVFNTITGLYVAKSGLIRLDKCRSYGLLSPEININAIPNRYLEHNQDILYYGERIKRIIDITQKEYSKLFIHFQLVPAMLELRDVIDIDEHRLAEFFRVLDSHEDLSAAYFVIELYPLSVEFVAFIMVLRYNLQLDFDEILSYKTMLRKLLGQAIGIDGDAQRVELVAEYRSAIAGLTYTDMTEDAVHQDRYMRTLMSVRLPKFPELVITERVCFMATLMGLCMIKCKEFRPLVDSMTTVALPQVDDRTVLYVASHLPDVRKIEPLQQRIIEDSGNSEDKTDAMLKEANCSCDKAQTAEEEADEDDDSLLDNDDGFDDHREKYEILPYDRMPSASSDSCAGAKTDAEDDERKMIREAFARLTVRPSLSQSETAMNRAIQIVYEPKDEFDYNVAAMVMMMSMSMGFNYENFKEFITALSTVFVTENVNKKIIVFYGHQNTGKTKYCDIIQRYTVPDCGRLNVLDRAHERSSITTLVNVMIINEINNLTVEIFKSISGNDSESKQIFYSQEYELKSSQALIFGATNICINFKTQNSIVDKTTVDRLHAIKFVGKQVTHSNVYKSLFAMLLENEYFKNTLKLPDTVETNAFAWLVYYYYAKNRDQQYRPMLDTTNKETVKYRERVYLANNRLYDFIRKCGLSEAKDFYIPTQTFCTIINSVINEKTSIYQNYNDFEKEFIQQYDIKLSDISILNHFQQTCFVLQVEASMKTVDAPDHIITFEDLENRLKMYNVDYEKTNARSFFIRYNDHRKYTVRAEDLAQYGNRVKIGEFIFKNVKFAHVVESSYYGNVMSCTDNTVLYDRMHGMKRAFDGVSLASSMEEDSNSLVATKSLCSRNSSENASNDTMYVETESSDMPTVLSMS